MANTKEILLPTKPTEPVEADCCGTGCALCVFDIYKTQLQRWEKQCEAIQEGGMDECKPAASDSPFVITPFEFRPFPLIDILPDDKSSKIYRFSCVSSCKNDQEVPKTPSAQFPVCIGHHVVIRIGTVSKQYTVLRLNKETNSFDVLIKIYPRGQLTPMIDKLGIGDNVDIRGPLGTEFKYKLNSYDNILIMAAGTGLAPMYRIVEDILHNDEEETKIKLLYSCKSVEEVLQRETLRVWSGYWNFYVDYFLSFKSDVIPYGWKVHFKKLDFSFVRNIFESKLFKNRKNLFLICGTISFEKDMLNYLHRLGIDDAYIRVF